MPSRNADTGLRRMRKAGEVIRSNEQPIASRTQRVVGLIVYVSAMLAAAESGHVGTVAATYDACARAPWK